MKPKTLNADFILSVFFGVIISAIGVVLAFMLMRAIDAATEGDFNTLIFFAALIVGLAVVEYIVAACYKLFSVRYASKALEVSKNKLFSSTIKGTGQGSDSNIAMFTTNTDVVYLDYYQNKIMLFVFGSQMIFSIIGIIFLHWLLFVVALVSSLLTMLSPMIFQKLLQKRTQVYSEKSKEYIDRVTDSLAGIREIKSFFAQGFFEKKHANYNKAAEKARASRSLTAYMMNKASEAFGSLTFISIIVAGGFLVINGHVTVGVLIAVVQLLNGMVSPIGNISSALGEIAGAKKIANDYFATPQIKEGMSVANLTSAIEVSGLSYTYPEAAKPTFENVNMRFVKGRAHAIIGESGSGKTTLAKILAGIYSYEEGKVTYDNHDINELCPIAYAGRVRYISQAEHLFRLSIRENVEFGQKSEDYENHIKNLGLASLLERSDEEFAEGVDLLSAGQKQRIALARTLCQLPDVLILDEPTANMDEETALEVIAYLKSIKNLTLIVITHAGSEKMLEHFDEVIRKRQGR